MKKSIHSFFAFAVTLFLFSAAPVGALDFGLVINQEAKVSNEAAPSSKNFFYTPVLRPWVSGPLGKAFSLYLSGSVGFEYVTDFGNHSAWRSPVVLPELERSELTWLVSPALYFRLGRQRFGDPTGLAASGLFDGLSAGFSAGGGRFSVGAWYTGLLYKNTADIIMTGRDRTEYQKPLSLDGSYFASRRALVSFAWENGLGPRSSLALGLLGQFDLNGGDDRLHSQYLSVRYGLRLSRSIELQGDAVVGMGEAPDRMVFFVGALGFNWALPGSPDDLLNIRGLYSSPSTGELSAFIPVSSLPQGQVFSPPVTGLSVLRGAYTLRPRPALSLTGEFSYFIRTDTVSFRDDREPAKLKGEGYFLGGECYGTALWTPLPDFALTFGGGAFFPRLGNAFTDEAKIRWKAALGLILSL